jgi:hypothetical protein
VTSSRDSTGNNTLSTPNHILFYPSPTTIAPTMQRTAHGISVLMSCRPESKDPAPIEEGSRAGYFDDRLTRHLLALSSEDVLLRSGTYGSKDLGQTPIDITALRGSSYDRRLLPFAPRGSSMSARNLDLHKVNDQWRVYALTAKDLKTQLDEVVKVATDIAQQISFNLPEYARQLIPKLLYKGDEEGEFPLQLQAFFSPIALCARVARIVRVIGMLEAYINLGHRILTNRSEWKFKEPVGISAKIEDLIGGDSALLDAYLFLGVPIDYNGYHPLAMTISFSPDDAKNALRGHAEGDVPAPLLIGSCPEELSGDDDDALKFAVICPEYDAEEYNSDGTRTTKRQRKDKRRMALEEAQASDGEEELTSSPRPPEDEAMQMDSVASALGVTLGNEPTSSHAPPAKPSADLASLAGPEAAFASPTGSTPVSSSSSSNVLYPSDTSSARRNNRPSRRSWHWANRHPRESDRGPEPSGSRRYEPYASSGWRDSARNQAPGLQVQRQPYRSSSMYDMRHQDAMTRYHYSPSPLPPPPAGVSAPVAARAEQNIIRDRGSGTLRTVTIIDTDFSQLGIPTGESAVGGQWPGAQVPLPYGRPYAPPRGPLAEYPYQYPHQPEQAGPSQYRGRGSHRGGHRNRQQTWRHQAPPPQTLATDLAQQWGASSPQVYGGGQLDPPQPVQTWGSTTVSPSDPAPLTSASAPASVRPSVAVLAPATPVIPPAVPTESSPAAQQSQNFSSPRPGVQPPPS